MKRAWMSLFALTTLAVVCRSATISERIAAVKKADTEKWRQIPWTATLLDARRASEKEKQPIFLFAHDGNIDTGRC
jgi:hypothetical protein